MIGRQQHPGQIASTPAFILIVQNCSVCCKQCSNVYPIPHEQWLLLLCLYLKQTRRETYCKLKTHVSCDMNMCLLMSICGRFGGRLLPLLYSLSCLSPLFLDRLYPEHGVSKLIRNGSTQRHMSEYLRIRQRRCKNLSYHIENYRNALNICNILIAVSCICCKICYAPYPISNIYAY